MAALSVVQKRLNAVGFGPFCLELHSNKSKKRDVLEQLRVATEVTKLQPADIFQKKADQAAQMRKELDVYASALHKVRRCGMSLYDMINGYESNREGADSVIFPRNITATLDSAVLEQQKLLVERMIVSAQAVGHPQNHPLRLHKQNNLFTTNQIRAS
jgi:hypothetical protein